MKKSVSTIKEDESFRSFLDGIPHKSGNKKQAESDERINETTQETSSIVQRFYRDAGDSL